MFYLGAVHKQWVEQLGGPDPWYDRGGPTKVRARKSFLFTEGSPVGNINNTWVILASHFKFLLTNSKIFLKLFLITP